MNSNLEISREARILRLTLNRPDKRNALTSDLCREIADAIDQAQDDATVGCILLDAKGDVFCAGMDLDEASAPDAHERTGGSGVVLP